MALLRARLLTLALLMVVAGCGGGGGTTVDGSAAAVGPAAETAEERLPFGLRRCPEEIERVTAPSDRYRSEPVYVGNEMPIDEVKAWATGKPGYEDIWIDRDHFGWITVAFSQDADRRQAELEEVFPGVGVVAVHVDWTQAELVALRDQAFSALDEAGFEPGGSHSVSTGLVSVWVGELVEERLAPLAPLAGPRLCVQGVASRDVIRPGPQPDSGDGWRLLGAGRTGATYRTGVATDEEQYESLWEESGLPGERPAVDFERDVVLWFGAVYGSGCDVRMDGVVFDTERSIVHPDLVVPGVHQGCPDDANPQAYVVAVERDHLPAGPFAVQLGADDPPVGVPEERTVVATDLRAPGSTAADDEIGIDPALVDGAARGPAVNNGGVVEPGYPARYRLDLRCGPAVVGPINGITWRSGTAELAASAPEAWSAVADNAGIVEVELLLQTGPPRLTLTANGHTETYEPSADATNHCP